MENKPDILGIIERAGFEPNRKGSAYWLSCPFHTDKTPSLKIDPARQTFFCFSCQSGGDSIAFIRKLHGLSFHDALKYMGIRPGQSVIINPQQHTKRHLMKAFRQWEEAYRSALSHELRECRGEIDYCGPELLHLNGNEIERMMEIETHLDILARGDDEEKFELYREVTSK